VLTTRHGFLGIPHFEEPVESHKKRQDSNSSSSNSDDEDRRDIMKAEKLIREAEEEQERSALGEEMQFEDKSYQQEKGRSVPKTSKSLLEFKPVPLTCVPRRSTVTASNYKSRELQMLSQQDVATPTISSRLS
jgi:hypothetical protein